MNKILVVTKDKKLLPVKMTDGSVCYDMFIENDFEIKPGSVEKVTTGVKTFLPIGWQVKVFARSSLATKNGLMLANSTAIFDADFRGNYIMQFYNYTKEILKFKKYSRLTQMEFAPYYVGSKQFGTSEIPEIEFIVDKDLYDNFEKKFETIRGKGGIGSTNI